MRILLTNHALVERGGTELWIRDLAVALLARGHEPIVYSRRLGTVAEALRAATVPVLDDLEVLRRPPDLIHAHHHLEAMTALQSFPRTPAVYVCHGWLPDEEAPPKHPRIARWVAVDALVRQRLVDECGLPEERVETRLNFVDLDRFRPRAEPLPERPARALVLSHHASESNSLPGVRAACHDAGIALDVVGRATGSATDQPEQLLPGYDLVFAKARSALEAAAVGAAVVLCDHSGLGTMVTTEDLDHLRDYNFGVRLLRRPVTAEAVAAELDRYDAADATEVSRRLRRSAGLDVATDGWIELYREVLDTFDPASIDTDADARAVARYLRHGPLRAGDLFQVDRDRLRAELASAGRWASRLEDDLLRERSGHERIVAERDGALAERDAAIVERDALAGGLESTEAERARLDVEVADLRDTLDEAERRIADLERELGWIRSSATWRWRERLLGGWPGLRRLFGRRGGSARTAGTDPVG